VGPQAPPADARGYRRGHAGRDAGSAAAVPARPDL
jgi:hypothetical protein